MFLQKQSKFFDTPQFYFDAARLLDGLVQYQLNAINNNNRNENLKLEYQVDNDLKDIENIKLLKEELGTDFIEKQMFKNFTRNNDLGDDKDKIKNKFQNNLYTDLQKQNNFLATMFLYFFHKFYYNDENIKELQALGIYETAGAANAGYIKIYKSLKKNGLPSAKIIEEIKTVYPYLHNLFVKLLQIKYGDQANIALMNIQDANQSLKEAELTGQIQKIKVKKPTKLELAKK